MPVAYREWKRDHVMLLLGLAGGTGSGKTMSALEIAAGIQSVTGAKIGGLDTENGRMTHYADRYRIDEYAELRAPYNPLAYAEAIEELATKRGCKIVLVDSMSHEWTGEGGMLDMQETDMRGEESRRLMSWIRCKGEHRKFVTRLLAVDAHVILCFRAEEKVDMQRGDGGRWEIVPKRSLKGLDGWIPISEKNLPFELTVSLLFTQDSPGIPKPIKLEEQHRAFVPLDRPVTRDVGAALARWAQGGESSSAGAAPSAAEPAPADDRSEEEIVAELDAVVGRLVATSRVTFSQIWGNVAKQRGVDKAAMRDLLDAGATEFRWDPLRESLTLEESRSVLARLAALEGSS